LVTRKAASAPNGAIAIVADLTQSGWESGLISVPLGCDLVYLAYQATNDQSADRLVNFDGLVSAVKVLSPRRVVFASSISVFGEDPGVDIVTEDAPQIAHSPYARDKMDAAAFLGTLGIRSVVLHFTIVYGEGDPRLRYYKDLLAGAYLVFKNGGNGLHNVIHAEDAASAVVSVLEHASVSGPFIANGQTVLVRDWFSWIESSLPRRPKAPAWLAPLTRGPVRRAFSAIGVRAPAIIPEPKATQFERRTVFDSSRLRRQTSWAPTRTI